MGFVGNLLGFSAVKEF